MLPVVIDTVENCDLLFEALKSEPIVAMDSEFVWTRSYFPFVGVIQIGISPEKSYLLDTAILPQCPQSLRDFLGNENIMKVFHDAYQDVMIINYYANTVTKNILDTQLAAAFTGFTRAVSLGELIEKVCNKTLSKSETLTNWMKRPLTQAQYEYALDDVRYLTDCAKKLIRLAEESGVWEWIMDDCNETLVVGEPFDFLSAVERTYMKEFTKVAYPNRLKLYRLCYAVEDLARKKNLPRSFLFKSGQLAQIINCNPENPLNLKKTSLSSKNQERYARFIIESVNNENVMIDENLIKKTTFVRDKNATLTNGLAKEIGVEFDKAANEKGIAVSRVYNRKQITGLVRSTLESKEVAQLRGWRNVFLGEIWNNFWENKREGDIL